MFGHGDYTHHTSEDTPDKVDPVELERAEIIGAAALLYLSELNESQALDLLYFVSANAEKRFGTASRRAYNILASATGEKIQSAWAEAQNVIDHALLWEKKTIESVLTYKNNGTINDLFGRLVQQLEAKHKTTSETFRWFVGRAGIQQRVPPVLDNRPDRRIAVRLTRGPLASEIPVDKLSKEDAAWYMTAFRELNRNVQYEIVNFVDGKRTVSEIRNAVSAEYSPVPIETVARYLDDLVKAGVMSWKR